MDCEESLQGGTSRSLAERRPRRQNILLPKRYRDIMPQPAPSLPPPGLGSPSPSLLSITAPEADTSSTPDAHADTFPLPSRVRRIIRTPRNIFGIVRQYFTAQVPTVDPEEHVTLEDMLPPSGVNQPLSGNTSSCSKWWPFPNKNSFLLGNWHWNGGL